MATAIIILAVPIAAMLMAAWGYYCLILAKARHGRIVKVALSTMQLVACYIFITSFEFIVHVLQVADII